MVLEGRLAACVEGDVDALCGMICDIMKEETLNQPCDQACEAAVPQVLRYLASKPAQVGHGAATQLVADEDNALSVYGDLLSGLLAQAKVRAQADEQRVEAETEVHDGEKPKESPGSMKTLEAMAVAYTTRIATELASGHCGIEAVKTLAAWADAVVEFAVAPVGKQDQPEGNAADTAWITAIASQFLRIHTHSAATRNDFRIMTLVWKNLSRLSTRHRAMLMRLCGGGGEADVGREASGSFSLPVVFEAVSCSLAETTQRLRLTATPPHEPTPRGNDPGVDRDEEDGDQDPEAAGDDAVIAHDLRMLRLFLRAFQNQFIHFVDTLVAQVECSVALAVDAIAAVLPIAEGTSGTSETIQHEAYRVLQCVVAFVETAARSDKLQVSTRSFLGTLLWRSSGQIKTSVEQTRTQFVDADHGRDATANGTSDSDGSKEDALLWGHTLATAAFLVVHGASDDVADCGPTQHTGLAGTNEPALACVAALLARFRNWSRRVAVGSSHAKTVPLFVDFVLEALLAHVASLPTLQLFLVEQTLHPDPNQRFVMWEIWRELLCFVWDDAVATHAFTTLLCVTHTKSGNGELLDPRARDEILQLLAVVYPEMGGAVKESCLQIVSGAYDVMCADGPGHKRTPELESSLDLLHLLASSSLLPEYDHDDKEEWVAHYLPITLECIGGVLELLEQSEIATSSRDRVGVLRVLDGGLLIMRAIFEDSDDASARNLVAMLLQICTETLTRLAKIATFTTRPSSTPSTAFTRVLESCLLLLTRLAPQIKRNHSNQCVQVVKDLVSILEADHVLTRHAVAIAVFVRDALSDVSVLPSDADVAWKLVARLFYKLSALHFGLQVDPQQPPLTPPQSVCLQALYAVLARSNLPAYANKKRSLKDWIVPHAQPRFATFVQILCEKRGRGGWGGAARRSDKGYERVDATLVRRFPYLPRQQRSSSNSSTTTTTTTTTTTSGDRSSTSSSKRPRTPPTSAAAAAAHAGDDMAAMDDVDQAIANAKRIKWDAFAATYWKFQDRMLALQTPADQQAFLDTLSETDLQRATAALQQLL